MAGEIDLRALRFLIAVSEAGSFGRAATRLHISQPALSVQVRHLEEHFGTALLKRSHRGVELTPAGELAVSEGARLLRSSESLNERIHGFASTKQSTLWFGFFANAAAELTPVLVRAFEQRRPDVNLLLREFPLTEPLMGMPDGRSDAALLRLPVDGSEQFMTLPLFAEPLVAVLPCNHRFARRATVKAEELLDEPWVSALDGSVRDFWTLKAHRHTPAHVVAERKSPAELWSVVASGRAICACPASGARYYHRPELAFVPIEDAEPSVCALAWHRDDQRPELLALLDAAEDARNRLPPELGRVGV
ncbi:MAG TPA: LysR family transcriptional regulator [Solirubrobacteraceae bacterium]|nr:LysR family transcriptional regulator [Solirubrobacteraceae bacterium]